MGISLVELTDFRNIRQATVSLSDQLTLVIGENGQGKTNFLEAVYLLQQGHDFRTSVEREVIRANQPVARLMASGIINNRRQSWHHVTPLVGRKQHQGPIMPVVLFSPEDVYLPKGSPEGRRKFLDLVLQSQDARYARSLRNYQRLVVQRNRALKEPSYHTVIDDFTPLLVKEGWILWQRRQELVNALVPVVKRIHSDITGDDNISLTLIYGGAHGLIAGPEEFETMLQSRRTAELTRQTTLVGPHRDDIQFLLDDMDTRLYASQGQLRTISLSLKLATYNWLYQQTGLRPLILLDDVLSELDGPRRKAVLEAVARPGQQTIVTDTEPRSYAQLSPVILKVQKGEFRPWNP